MLVAENHALVRATLAAAVSADRNLELAGTAATVDEAVELARVTSPDVVVVEVGIPIGGAARAAQELRRLPRMPHLVALGAAAPDPTAIQMLASGACCFVVKERAANVVDAILWATQGERKPFADVVSLDSFRIARR